MEKPYRTDEQILADQLPDHDLKAAYFSIQRLKMISKLLMCHNLERHERAMFYELQQRGIWMNEEKRD